MRIFRDNFRDSVHLHTILCIWYAQITKAVHVLANHNYFIFDSMWRILHVQEVTFDLCLTRAHVNVRYVPISLAFFFPRALTKPMPTIWNAKYFMEFCDIKIISLSNIDISLIQQLNSSIQLTTFFHCQFISVHWVFFSIWMTWFATGTIIKISSYFYGDRKMLPYTEAVGCSQSQMLNGKSRLEQNSRFFTLIRFFLRCYSIGKLSSLPFTTLARLRSVHEQWI